MTEAAKAKMLFYQNKILFGKSVAPSERELMADKKFMFALNNPGEIPFEELKKEHEILSTLQNRADMTDDEWLELEKEIGDFIASEGLSADDCTALSDSGAGEMLHMMCDAIREIRRK